MSIPGLPKELLAEIRGHPQFPQLVAAIRVPQPPSYSPSPDAPQPDKQSRDWIYQSGFKDGAIWLASHFGIRPEDFNK